MADSQSPSPAQAAALRMAAVAGKLRRLDGGYWVRQDHPAVTQGAQEAKEGEWIGSQTVYACLNRGWFERSPIMGLRQRPDKQPVALTAAGVAALTAADRPT